MLPATRPPATFLGAAVAELEDLAAGDVVMTGLFMDHGDRVGFGARFAARQIRYASRPAYGMAPLRFATPPGTFTRGRLLDAGDLNVFPLEPERHAAALERQLKALMETGARTIVVGGSMRLDPIVSVAASQLSPPMTMHPVLLRSDACASSMPPTGELFITLDISGLFEPAPVRRAKARLLSQVAQLPAKRVRAAHLTGLAPELDLSARHDAAVAALMLDALARHLLGGDTPCH